MCSLFAARSERWTGDGQGGVEAAACTACHDPGHIAPASPLDAATALTGCPSCGAPDLDRDIPGIREAP